MPSSPPSFIRLFAQTDDTPIGQYAQEYLRSMIRIAPVRLVSVTGGLVGSWSRWSNLLLTPMVGSYVNAVCTHASNWVWTSSVPMTNSATDDDGLPAAPHVVVDGPPGDRHHEVEMPAPQPTTEIAERVEELYTPKVRNVLFMVSIPGTEQQRAAAMKYEDRIATIAVAQAVASQWPDVRFEAGIVPVPVRDHARIREAILGPQ